MRTASLTALALAAFAANSVLCRLALAGHAIDAASFSSIRFVSGAIVLAALARGAGVPRAREASWGAAALLFLYAVPFSFAYLRLTAGTGALILFVCVQLTMMSAALAAGERLRPAQWMGFASAAAGLVYLVSPGLASPPLESATMMAVAGAAWGLYSLRGRGVTKPLTLTAGNFARAVPFMLAASAIAFMWSGAHVSTTGLVLAIASGALASGIGYVVWYAALGGLTTAQASVVQLAVPVIAALGGVLFLGETISGRLVAASGLVLGGIALTTLTVSRH